MNAVRERGKKGLNKQERDILNALLLEPYINQRTLSELCGHSLGVVNHSIKNLIIGDYLDDQMGLTEKAKREFAEKAPKNAIILAAGFGMRMVPINMESPKALVEVNGEPLIERIIRQLHEVEVTKIYVVVGFMKERFEYLIDEFGVELIINEEYASKNNLHSMALALDYISNSYIVPCDIWCNRNPFHKQELYSWYMVSDLVNDESSVRVNRKMELVSVQDHVGGNAMVGISYLVEEQAAIVRKRIREFDADNRHENAFWEDALYERDKMIVYARVVHATDVVEIDTYEQLRELDEESDHLKSDAINIISQAFGVAASKITDIEILKKGMTNRSFLFNCKGKRYIMRIPGEGTGQLIDREEDYRAIAGEKVCDDIVYMNPRNGYKITEYLETARVCNPTDLKDVRACMRTLRRFHEKKLKVKHEFDVFGQIEFYEQLWNGTSSIYKDYVETKENVFLLKSYIDKHVEERVLTHIDAVPDNFLFVKTADGSEVVRLIDWEYAGMQDPHVDIAMFCIYSFYDKQEVDQLISIYFEDKCPDEIRVKIYCYIAACGLLWSNWCEYKRNCGIEFGEYSLRQYRYAKEYFRIVEKELKGEV